MKAQTDRGTFWSSRMRKLIARHQRLDYGAGLWGWIMGFRLWQEGGKLGFSVLNNSLVLALHGAAALVGF